MVALLILLTGVVLAVLMPSLQCHSASPGITDEVGPCPNPILKYIVAVGAVVAAWVVYRRSIGRTR
jgi:hypothetical protein